MDASDISGNEKLDDKVFCEKQYKVAGITAGEDSQNECQIFRKNKVVSSDFFKISQSF